MALGLSGAYLSIFKCSPAVFFSVVARYDFQLANQQRYKSVNDVCKAVKETSKSRGWKKSLLSDFPNRLYFMLGPTPRHK